MQNVTAKAVIVTIMQRKGEAIKKLFPDKNLIFTLAIVKNCISKSFEIALFLRIIAPHSINNKLFYFAMQV